MKKFTFPWAAANGLSVQSEACKEQDLEILGKEVWGEVTQMDIWVQA